MAALRLTPTHCPPTAASFTHTPLLFPSPRLLYFTAKPQRFNFQILLASAQIQAVQSQSADVNVVEEDNSSNTRVLVQNLPWTCTVDDLRPLFDKYGTIVDIEFSMYNKTRNRGLAFVTMSSHEEALAVLNSLESTEFEGRVLKLNWAIPKKVKPASSPQPKPMPVHNLFVANLPFEARANDLKEFFNSENSNVVSAEVIFQDNPRRSAGYGFVSFNTKAEADAALLAFQGKEFMGRPIRVAQSKRFLRQETKATIQQESNEGT